MIRLPLPNKNFVEPIATLSQPSTAKSVSLQLYDVGNLKKNEDILIKNPGEAQARVHKVTSIEKDENEIYISPALDFSYASDTEISRIHWHYFLAEISYDGGTTYSPLSSGPIPYATGHIPINAIPYYPSEDSSEASPKIRYKYIAPAHTKKDTLMESGWFHTNANPYTPTIVGNVDNTRIRIESLIARCNYIYGQQEGKSKDSDAWLMWFNMCLDEHHQYFNLLRPETDKKIFYFVVTPRLGTYEFGFDPLSILKVSTTDDLSVGPIERHNTTLHYKNSLRNNPASGGDCTPPEYFLTRHELVLDPVPTKEYSILIERTGEPFRFTYEAPTIEVPRMFEDLFVFYALTQEFAISGDSRASWAAGQYKSAISRFVTQINTYPMNRGQSGDLPASLSEARGGL